MRKYVSVVLTKGDIDWEEDREFLPALQVDGSTAEYTGLVDASNNPIMKLPRPIGFGRENEW